MAKIVTFSKANIPNIKKFKNTSNIKVNNNNNKMSTSTSTNMKIKIKNGDREA